MKYILFLGLTFSGTPAHANLFANFFKTFCDKYLIAEDPHQYEQMETEVVVREYLRLGARYNWYKHPHDAVLLRIAGNDLRFRILIGTAKDFEDEIKVLIESYGHFENPHGL